MNKLQKQRFLFLTMYIGLLILILGIAYAYFTAIITGNETTETISLKSGALTIHYENGKDAIADNIFPQAEPIAVKTFSIIGNISTEMKAEYFIELHVTKNTFSNGTIKFTMESENVNGESNVAPEITSQVGIPKGQGVYALGNGHFTKGINQVHTYSLFLYYPPDPDKNQVDELGKEIKAYININEVEAVYDVTDSPYPLLAQVIKDGYKIKNNADFSIVANNATQSGLYTAEDDYGTSYYFRGIINNNNLVLGGYHWKIIRIDGKGNIKLFYYGIDKVVNETGVYPPAILGSKYNESHDNNKYFGYVIDGEPSIIKKAVDKFYESLSDDVKSKIVNSIYCNDLTIASGTGLGTTNTDYSFKKRMEMDKPQPTLACPSEEGSLILPIGLITADELVFAGANVNAENFLYHLNKPTAFWTMTPARFNNGKAYGYIEGSTGNLLNLPTSETRGVSPVITISSKTRVIGDGSETNPYQIIE